MLFQSPCTGKAGKKGNGNLHAAGFSLGLLDIYNTSRNKESHMDYGLRNQPVHWVCACMCTGTEILATDPEKEPTTNLSLQLLNYLSVDTY